jgi:L-threonylcarbamoyladenylate synthase
MQESYVLEATKVLHGGGVVAHPTETCYGLAVDIFQKKAIEDLYRMKQMPLTKPVSILIRDIEDARRYGEFSDKAIALAVKYWPGPLTIIVPRTSLLPKWVNPGVESVGFRMSSNKRTRELVERFGGPLTTTSANVSGLPQAYAVSDFDAQDMKPDYVIDGGRIGKTPPSTIVRVLGDELEVIRQGGIVLGL